MEELIKNYCHFFSGRCVKKLGLQSWLVSDKSHRCYVVKIAVTENETAFLTNQARWQRHRPDLTGASFIEFRRFEHYSALLSHYIPGPTLSELIRGQWHPSTKGPPDLILMADTVYRLQQEVHKLHKSHVIHGDLKPQNVVCECQAVTLLDFANARKQHSDDTHRQFYSYSCSFSLPQQQQGVGSADIEKDQYGFFCMLHIAMNGHLPRIDWRSNSPLNGIFDQSIKQYLNHLSESDLMNEVWQLNEDLVCYSEKA